MTPTHILAPPARRRLRGTRTAVAVALASAAAAALASGVDEPPSSIVYPEQQIPLRFNHTLHLETFGLECTMCHVTIPESTRVEDRNIPDHEQCGACHVEIEPEEEACTKCHVDAAATPRATFPPARLRFTHQLHVEQGIACETCHIGIRTTELATVDNLPRMDTCLDCHDGRRAPQECATCHPAQDGRLLTWFDGDGPLQPRSHTEGWVEDHKPSAETGVEFCLSCHSQPSCLDCHDGSVKPPFHASDWVLLHSRHAFTNELLCASCHDAQVFCRDCHERLAVTLSSLSPERGFHPDGWALFDPGRPAVHHSNTARRNLNACVSCHLEQDCLQCHSGLGGPGFSPHPPGFDGRRLRDANPGLCLRCHVPGDPRIR